MQFSHAVATYSGERFQDLFAEIMERRHKGFQRVRPWGRQGDRKNDGWLPEEKTIFQCYAPSTFGTGKLEAKLLEDYEGAAKHWKGKFTSWVFVHNDRSGMSPAVTQLVCDLNDRSNDVTATSWGPYRLLEEFGLLTEGERVAILGPVLSPRDFMDIDAAALKPLIDALGVMRPDPGAEVRPVPVEKIHGNDLTDAQVDFLRMGASRAPLVDHFMNNAFTKPDHVDGVAAAVAQKYQTLRNSGQAPSQTFEDILAWVSGGSTTTAVLADALAIVAYFFARCHIFELPA